MTDNADAAAPPLSLYFHIPFCDTLCYFCGCNMMVTSNRETIILETATKRLKGVK